MAFTDTYVTDNAMPNRDTEDGSKIFYLVNPNRIFRIIIHPQILHELGMTDTECIRQWATTSTMVMRI